MTRQAEPPSLPAAVAEFGVAVSSPSQVEFSRQIKVDTLGEEALLEHLEANGDERAALADRFELLDLSLLQADLQVQRLAGRPLIRVEGRFEAQLSQACVVTLQPVATGLSGEISRLYTLEPAVALQDEVQVELDQDDPPDPVTGGRIDLGELVAEELSLAIDPYPRIRDADAAILSWEETAETASPFAALEGLKLDK